MSDLKLSVATLQAKQARCTELFNYYQGNQPIRYAAERLREIFQDQQTNFTENWCAVVVDAVLDRLGLSGFDVTGAAQATDRLNRMWAETRLIEDSGATMRAALVTGEAYVLAWRNEEGIEAYYNDPRLCHVWYEAANPNRKRFGAKWWRDDEDVWRLNLFYPDRIEYYLGRKSDDPQPTLFVLESEEANPWGVIPLFHFYGDRWLHTSELTNVLPLQDSINMLFGNMMITADFGALPQKWAITNADISKLRSAPDVLWSLPAAVAGEQPVSIGQFQPTDLSNYLDAIDRQAAAIAIISRTPKHFLFSATGQAPSGEALIAMEAPLNRKVGQYQARFGVTWQELAAYLLLLDGLVVDPLAILPQWEPAETIQPRTQAEIRQISVAAGMPLTTILRDEGWTDDELADMATDQAAEQARMTSYAAATLESAQRDFDAGVAQ